MLLAVRVPNFDVDSFRLFVCLSFCPSTVVRYYMQYTGLSLGPSPLISFQSRREGAEIVSIGVFLKKKKKEV